MNLTINTSTSVSVAASATAAILPPTADASLPPTPTDAGPVPAPAPAEPALVQQSPLALAQFGQWLQQAAEAVGGLPADAAQAPEQAPAVNEELAATEQNEPVAQLGAMSMPLMPMAAAAQATLAAVAAALPGAPSAPVKTDAAGVTVATAPAVETAVRTATTLLDAQVSAGKPQPALAAEPTLPARRDAAPADPAAGIAIPAVQAQPVMPAIAARVVSEAAKEQPPARVRQDSVDAAPAVAKPQTQAGTMAGFGDSGKEQSSQGGERTPSGSTMMMNATAAPTPGAASDSVTLAGPPTAWRQSLQEALGERLHLQVGRNAEQAVIRLEPPMLGQVEISIRHSAGALEVHISATHHEVLRQLQAVSENLRSDLAQRQFTEVAVNVSAARASNGAAQSFAGEQQGRGRQQDGSQDGQQDDRTPGLALAEAHLASSAFSLTGR